MVSAALARPGIEESLQVVLGEYSHAGDLNDISSFHSNGADGAFRRYLGRERKEHNLFNKQFAYDSAGQSSISFSHN